MRCMSCKKKFRDLLRVVPIHRYVENNSRGDFVSGPVGYIHYECIEKRG